MYREKNNKYISILLLLSLFATHFYEEERKIQLNKFSKLDKIPCNPAACSFGPTIIALLLKYTFLSVPIIRSNTKSSVLNPKELFHAYTC